MNYRIVNMWIEDIKENNKFMYVWRFYVLIKEEEKVDFWDELYGLNSYIKELWLVVSDFNELYFRNDKKGGVRVGF